MFVKLISIFFHEKTAILSELSSCCQQYNQGDTLTPIFPVGNPFSSLRLVIPSQEHYILITAIFVFFCSPGVQHKFVTYLTNSMPVTSK